MIRPADRINHDRVRAFVVTAIDQEPRRTGRPHFPEGDFLFAHGLLTRRGDASRKPKGLRLVYAGTLDAASRPKSLCLQSFAIGMKSLLRRFILAQHFLSLALREDLLGLTFCWRQGAWFSLLTIDHPA